MSQMGEWGATLKDLSQKLLGKKQVFTDLKPGDPGYPQHVFGIEINEKNCRPKPPQPGAHKCTRYGQQQRAQKLARKGQRRKKRYRQSGPDARYADAR